MNNNKNTYNEKETKEFIDKINKDKTDLCNNLSTSQITTKLIVSLDLLKEARNKKKDFERIHYISTLLSMELHERLNTKTEENKEDKIVE